MTSELHSLSSPQIPPHYCKAYESSLRYVVILHSLIRLSVKCLSHAQTCSQQARELTEQQSLVRERESCIQSSQDCSRKLEQELKKERARLHKLEGEVGALEVVREGLTRDLEKSHTFSKKVAKALALDRGTAEILAGDFAQDAILMKAEQLAKQEVTEITNHLYL